VSNNRLLLQAWLTLGSLVGASLAADGDMPPPASQGAKASPYLGQPEPGVLPQRFAPGVVSTSAIELNGVFTPDLREFFFARLIDGVQTMYHSELVAGTWTAPRPLLLFPDERRAVADDPTVSPDGSELYFLGNHPAGVGRSDIWRSTRIGGRWSTAEVLPPPINTESSEVYPVVVGDGSLYFTSDRRGGLSPRSNLYRAQRLRDGSFATPVPVPAPANSEFGVGDTYVSPDESYMVLTSSRPPSPGGGDLFVSFRRPGGGWSEPAHLGPTINTGEVDFCPMVTPDGRFLFFSRRQGASWAEATAGDVYWVDAKILEQFRR
jgi:Tol biopolymer transport system component